MSTGNIVGTIAAAATLYFTGGNVGAAAFAYNLGNAAGNALDPPKGPTIHGPRLSDKSVQTSTYGTLLPRFYGTVAVSGNLTWLEHNQLKETVRKKKQGGKGGGSKTTVKTYSYSATFILSLGIGPIAGVRRIWCADKLIYNAGSDDLETIIASNQNAEAFRFYLGTDDQLPDPRYEAAVGVGNAPAYRGEAYIAFYDFQLADYGNSLQGAQFKVEVVTEKAVFTPTLVRNISYQAGADGNAGFTIPASFDQFSAVLAGADSGTSPTKFLEVTHYANGGKISKYGPELSSSIVPNKYYRAHWGVGLPAPIYAKFNGSEWYMDGKLFFPPGITAASDQFFVFPLGDGLLFNYRAAAGGTSTLYTLTGQATFPGFNLFCVDGLRIGATNSTGTQFALIDEDLVQLSTITLQNPLNPASNTNGWSMDMDDQHIYLARTTTFLVFDYAGNLLSQRSIPNNSITTYQHPMVVDGSLMVRYRASGPHGLQVVQLDAMAPELAPLADIIESEVALSSLLTAADVDTSLLTAQVRGYRVSGGSIRSALEPLQGAYPFDVIQSGYQLKCVPRGQASSVAIPWEDLGAADGDTPGDLLQESREMDSQLPALVALKYLDAAREYAVGEQSKGRINTQAINRVDREVSLVLTADEAAQMADILVNLPWLERTPAKFTLPPPYLALEPADVVTVVTPSATHEFRLTDINYTPDGRLECEAKPNRAALYTSNAKGGEGVPPSGEVPLAGPTLLLVLDIPVVDETIQNAPGFGAVAVGYTSGWPGAVAFRSIDAGQTWTELQGFTGLPTLGYARGTLPASTCTLIDQRSLVVDLISGELESVTRDQMLAGINYAAYGLDGRWEIVRFQNAVLQSDGSYLLSGFVRGERGTEWATGLHQASDYFVLLDDPDNVFIDMAVGSIGVPATYRGVTSGASIDSASDVPFTYQGVNLECLSPAYAKGTRDGSGNFSGTFTRRSRLSSSWWTNGVEAPLGETTEAYEIDVMSGTTVKRTITASTPAFNYSASNQVLDFGSVQSTIDFRIYQMSQVVGPGYPLMVTL